MEQNGRLNLHYLLRTCILFGIAIYIVHLVKTDNILYYIAPRMIIYVKLAAIGLYAVAVYQGYLTFKSFWGKVDDCDCEHPPSKSKFKNTILYSLFLVPLLLGFLLPDNAMGSALVSKKGINLGSSNTIRTTTSEDKATTLELSAETDNEQGQVQSNDTENLDKLFVSDQFTEFYAKHGKKLYSSDLIQVQEDIYIETLTTLDLYMDNFIGKELEISGFVYRGDTMTENQFVVARIALQCCSADASPYGILVEFPNAENYSADTWVKVRGVIEKGELHEMDIIKLDVKSIEKIETPTNLYVYPNFEFEP